MPSTCHLLLALISFLADCAQKEFEASWRRGGGRRMHSLRKSNGLDSISSKHMTARRLKSQGVKLAPYSVVTAAMEG